MEDLHRGGDISIPPEYISSHLPELEKEFAVFKLKVDKELERLKKENRYLFDKYHFDKTGRGYILVDNLSEKEIILKNQISNRFSFANFFCC